ncbi:hypothetical protein OG301_39185 (plasmid) [Streptomyces platensis]|uniref:hypothetical protein n=1 Tax=Streptomyces platensis TaxID=58346 RepID=UPI002ED40577|nr:hypothetical protein OG301_39185 [Streptomyces platensis]
MNPRRTPKLPSPLLIPAIVLSTASLAWTTWSLVDLLGAGPVGLTVAAGSDVIWGSVIVAEARGLRIPLGKRKTNLVPLIGWAALLVVAGFLAWHGINKNIPAMAVAGPFLPIGAKGVWALALTDMRDPAALTDTDKAKLADLKRGMKMERAKHDIEMERREMNGELILKEVDTDFAIELSRQDKARDLFRRRPLELPTSEANTQQSEPGEANGERVLRLSEASTARSEREIAPAFAGELLHAEDANAAAQTTSSREAFGFAAVLQGETRRENAPTRKSRTSHPTQANAKSKTKPSPSQEAKANNREAALATYRESVANGKPLTGAELGRRYGHTPRWGQQLIAEAKNH